MAENNLVNRNNRDASPAIRGYVYQVERTIQRWLRLSPGESLALECGEDLAVISRAVVDGREYEQHVFEQIKSVCAKARQGTTLRDVLESLAHFVLHHQAYLKKSDQKIRFCFATNAVPAIERPPGIDEMRGGIELWSEVVEHKLDKRKQKEVCERLRTFLSQCSRPTSLNEQVWDVFRQFLKASNKTQWQNFVESVEWQTGLSEPLRLSQDNQKELLASGMARTQDEAKAIYDRLFVHVFSLLSQEQRELLRADEWRSIGLHESDAAECELLQERLNVLETKLEEMARPSLDAIYVGKGVGTQVEELLNAQADIKAAFSGREHEMEKLDAFVNQEGGGVLLITAGPGWGKTSLLANWIVRRRSMGNSVVCHLWSGQNEVTRSLAQAYRHLVVQVCRYYDLKPPSLPSDAASLRDILCGLLLDKGAKIGKPLLMVLDGLDEAEEDVPVLLTSCPDGVYIIASARADEGECPDFLRSWVRTASTRLHLGPLLPAEIALYTERIGFGSGGTWWRDPNVIQQIAKKTQGFPLYLRFLLDDLKQAASTSEDEAFVLSILADVPKGFQDYINQAMGRLAASPSLRDGAVQRVFALLCVARGVMSQEEVEQLADVSVWNLLAMRWDVMRWLRVHEVKSGERLYEFSHPLLAQEFARALGREAERARQRVLDYCREWSQHRGRYALRLFAEHLEERELDDELFALAADVDFSQMQSEEVPDDPELPLRTTRVALRRAMKIDDPEAMTMFVWLHAHQIASMRAASPLEELRLGRLERAWRIADLTGTDYRILWHLLLAWELTDAGRAQEAQKTLERILEKKYLKEMAGEKMLQLSSWHGDCAVFLLLKLVQTQREIALALALRILQTDDLASLSVKLAKDRKLSDITTALVLAAALEEEWRQVRAFCDIGEARANAADHSGARMAFLCALEISQKEEQSSQSWHLADIAKGQARAGLLNDALGTLRHIRRWHHYLDALDEICPSLMQGERAEEAFSLVQHASTEVGKMSDNNWFLSKLAKVQARLGLWAEAEATTRSITAPDDSDSGLHEVIKAYAKAGEFTEALRLCGEIADVGTKCWSLRKIASTQARVGHVHGARDTLIMAVADSHNIVDEESRAEELASIAEEQAEAGFFDDALKTARSIPPTEIDNFQDSAYGRIAVAQAQARQFKDAFTTLGLKEYSSQREFARIAGIYAHTGQINIALSIANRLVQRDVRCGFSALLSVAKMQLKDEATQDARSTIAIALCAEELEDSKWLEVVARSFVQLGELLVKQGSREDAQTVLEHAALFASLRPSSNLMFNWWLRRTSLLQAEIGLYDEAEQTAGAIDSDHMRDAVAKDIKRIRDIAGSDVESAGSESGSKHQSAPTPPIFFEGEEEQAHLNGEDTSLEEKLSRARDNPDVRERVECLCSIAAEIALIGDNVVVQTILEEALQNARQLDEEYARKEAFEVLLRTTAAYGQIQDALTIAKECEDSSDALVAVVEGLISADLLEEAYNVALTILSPPDRVKVECRIALCWASRNDTIKTNKLIDGSLTFVQTKQCEGWRSSLLGRIAVTCAEAHLGERALQILSTIPTGGREHLTDLGSALAGTGDRESFKQVLWKCAYHADAVYAACSELPHLYPTQTNAVAQVLIGTAVEDARNRLGLH